MSKLNPQLVKYLRGGVEPGVKYVGRTTDFKGKPLWEILADQEDLGIGRMVIRNMFQRYKEPCYLRILDVDAVGTSEKPPKVRVTVQKTWRGVTIPKPIVMYSTTYKADYELVPKEEEEKYLKNSAKISEKILPTHIDLPPLMREFVREETGNAEPTMKVHFKKTHNKFVRLAGDGEKPTLTTTMGLGTPASPNLYKDCL